MSTENNIENGDIFVADSGDVFVKINDDYCTYLGNFKKANTDFAQFLPIMGNNEVEVIGNVDIVGHLNSEMQH